MDDQKEPLDAEHVDATQARRPTAEESELFGLLAVRDGFISAATLEAAKVEADTKSQPLANVLVTIGAMSDEERRLSAGCNIDVLQRQFALRVHVKESLTWNRRMRSRMPSGVGAGVGTSPATRFRRLYGRVQ